MTLAVSVTQSRKPWGAGLAAAVALGLAGATRAQSAPAAEPAPNEELSRSAELLSVAARVEGGRLRSEARCVSNAERDEKGLFCLSTVAAR